MATNLLDKKLEYWEHQLLDLGRRNKMINYRETKRATIKLIEPAFDELFRRFALNEETLTFQRSVDRETDIRVFSILSLLENLSVPLPVTIGDIKTEGSILERQKTLKNLRSKSRLALEEQGTNILYLSFGFIEWKDGKRTSTQWIKSPLILVPAVLAMDGLNSPYTLKKHEDDIVVNPTLEYYLKMEYGIELPQFDADKCTIDSYLKELEEIADQRGWRILKEMSLGLLSFLKISMYNDLLRNEERIKKNPVIRAMAGDFDEVNEIPEHLRTFELDSISTQDCYQVMSADSSQQEAILYSKNNISFVMQGPPGTGKSQTITNIIAEALAEGKRVLFVSEKMAALQVVYRRLQEAHLGDFCLPLHSYKANKKEILEQIGSNLNLKQTKVKDSAINKLEELLAIRQELNKYAAELHALNPELNISCYEAYSKLEEVNDAPTITFVLDHPLGVSAAKLQSFLNDLKEYALSLERLHYAVNHNPWEGLSSRMSGYEYTEQIKTELITVIDSIQGVANALDEITELQELDNRIGYTSVLELSEFLIKICELPQLPDIWVEDFNVKQSINTATEAKNIYSKLFTLRSEIKKVFSDEIYQYDYNDWKDKLLAKANDCVELPLLHRKIPNFFIEEAVSLHPHFEKIKATLTDAYTAFEAINNLLGTDFTTSTYHYQTIVSLSELLHNNIILHKIWFSSDIEEIKCLVTEVQSETNEIKNVKEKLLRDWEPDILSLDYAPIFTRYKTEYTSVFKVFKKQYNQDKNQIRLLSKNVIKKLTDETAIELLITLKLYHDKMDWFDNKSAELLNLLGDYYKGVDSDWDAILNALSVCSSFKNLSIGEISDKLLDIVEAEHSETSAKVDKLLARSTTALAVAKDEIKTIELAIDIDSVKFNVVDTLQGIETYLKKLDEVLNQMGLLKPYLVNSSEKINTIYHTIEQLNFHSEVQQQIARLSQGYSQQFGYLFDSENTDWNSVLSLLNRVAEVKKSNFFNFFASLINTPDVRKKELLVLANQIKEIYSAGTSAFDWIKQQFLLYTELQTMTIKALYEKMVGCLDNIDILEPWIDYQEAKEQCIKTGLEDFINKFENACLYENIEKVFLKGFYHMWLGAVCDKSIFVRRFRRNIQDERVKKFIELDDLQLLIAQMRIREKLIKNLPSEHRMIKATDEVAILNKELSKKRNIMPLRKLFRRIPNLLMKLKPCLMMSPLSVSYFLEAEAYHFDLVIFDEASQIFPEDAIGAIFRGSQVIIAGDSKQLPPTSFFTSSTNNFDSDYDTKDEEDYYDVVSDSILEESASVLPNRMLLWHYRSKHENLIAFSNREIYKNNLITFPNSINNVPDMGVEYIYVEDGCYDRGGKKNNIREAEECVGLVFEHIDKYPDRSLGIIAFSESQQTTIENAIIDYRERNSSYEWFFDESRDEPFFVKNLENVQGDERDTIIFSICYGKDKNGTMYMNFGPIGHDGGERRLNVAITRAKCNIKLVGSILPSDIDINRAKSEGVRMLRSYIEYARKGVTALRSVEGTAAFAFEDDFSEIIARFLEENGYIIQKQVGCSDYKIDIAVINPDAEGEYIAGIECDGPAYIHARTARDRDHLRRNILQHMGWNLYRVWSTEWSRNPKAEQNSLLEFLKSIYDKNGKVIHAMKQSNSKEIEISIDTIALETNKTEQKGSPYNPYGFTFYTEANWWEANHSGSSNSFTRASENILYIVSIEQPIHLEMLYKRMAPSFSMGKATESIKRTIDQVIEQKLKGQIVIDNDRFVRCLPLYPIKVRIPKAGETPRPIEYIHTEEVAAAMREIVKRSFGITEDDLASECARVFGFERKGVKIKVKTDAAIKWLVENKKIHIIDEKVQWIGD